MLPIEQGDILKVEGIRGHVLVVSKNTFNAYEEVIACPVIPNLRETALHIPVSGKEQSGVVLCEQMKLLDLRIRGFKKIDEIPYEDIIDITDAIQGIFEY